MSCIRNAGGNVARNGAPSDGTRQRYARGRGRIPWLTAILPCAAACSEAWDRTGQRRLGGRIHAPSAPDASHAELQCAVKWDAPYPGGRVRPAEEVCQPAPAAAVFQCSPVRGRPCPARNLPEKQGFVRLAAWYTNLFHRAGQARRAIGRDKGDAGGAQRHATADGDGDTVPERSRSC